MRRFIKLVVIDINYRLLRSDAFKQAIFNASDIEAILFLGSANGYEKYSMLSDAKHPSFTLKDCNSSISELLEKNLDDFKDAFLMLNEHMHHDICDVLQNLSNDVAIIHEFSTSGWKAMPLSDYSLYEYMECLLEDFRKHQSNEQEHESSDQ